jgi:hypothetical protein
MAKEIKCRRAAKNEAREAKRTTRRCWERDKQRAIKVIAVAVFGEVATAIDPEETKGMTCNEEREPWCEREVTRGPRNYAPTGWVARPRVQDAPMVTSSLSPEVLTVTSYAAPVRACINEACDAL